MNPQENIHIEGILADSVRSYLGDPDLDSELQQERLRETCSALARILGQRLKEHGKWNRFNWVDDVLPTSATVPSPRELVVQGLIIWGQRKQSNEWVEPFLASVQVPEEGRGTLAYRIMCGDARRGLGTMPYGAIANQALPEEWLFTFSKAR